MDAIPETVQAVLRTLEAAGHEAWCVGGCVRDLLLKKTPDDWDVTTSALPEQTLPLFGADAVPTGLRHGTVTVRTAGGPVEVTTYRCDGAYLDHRRPETVTFTRSLAEDLSRRDFTVNAMAMDLRGNLRDPFGGRRDLQSGILRCVGEPDRRFTEDALRILRGLRFAAVLNFWIEPDTAAALHRCRDLLRSIAAERIRVELVKLLCGAGAAEVLREYPDVIGVFWPELLPLVGLDQQNRHHCYDVWEHTLHSLEAVSADPVLRLTMLLHDVGKPACFTVDQGGTGHFYKHSALSRKMADEMLGRLKFDTETRRTVVRLVEWHDHDIPRTDKGMRRALMALGREDLRRLIAVKRADNLAQAPEFRDTPKEIDKAERIFKDLLVREECFSLRQLAVNGKDLTALGLSGPEVGRTLQALLERVVDGDLPNDRETLLNWIRIKRG